MKRKVSIVATFPSDEAQASHFAYYHQISLSSEGVASLLDAHSTTKFNKVGFFTIFQHFLSLYPNPENEEKKTIFCVNFVSGFQSNGPTGSAIPLL